jgi:nitric oxide reductase NorE protein
MRDPAEITQSVGGPAALADAHGAGQTPKLAGDPGVWVFIFADMVAFGLFFTLFTIGRAENRALYETSRQALDPHLGLANTLILLTSGWLMVLAVQAAKAGERSRVSRFLVLAMLVGSCFAGTKLFEYTEKFKAGISMLTNEFFMYYFIFTGIHFLHFVLGMAALAVCLSKARGQAIDQRYVVFIESCASYWHMVDLLWIVLFPLLYLLQ